jgi:hypothetical protein
METYKFELIRADASQQITNAMSSKFKAFLPADVVGTFVDFMVGCGFDQKALYAAMQMRIEEGSDH